MIYMCMCRDDLCTAGTYSVNMTAGTHVCMCTGYVGTIWRGSEDGTRAKAYVQANGSICSGWSGGTEGKLGNVHACADSLWNSESTDQRVSENGISAYTCAENIAGYK